MDKLDAPCANTRVIERLVLGPLRPTYPTDVRFLSGVHLDWLLHSSPLILACMEAKAARYLHVNISSR